VRPGCLPLSVALVLRLTIPSKMNMKRLLAVATIVCGAAVAATTAPGIAQRRGGMGQMTGPVQTSFLEDLSLLVNLVTAQARGTCAFSPIARKNPRLTLCLRNFRTGIVLPSLFFPGYSL
jgi:hypothetical protein